MPEKTRRVPWSKSYFRMVNVTMKILHLQEVKSRMKQVAAGTFIAILVFLSAAITVAQDRQLTVRDVVKSSRSAVVLIDVGDDSGKPTTEGSGFIISPDGKVVTNHHVIAGARTGLVTLDSGASFTIDSFIADDAAHDIAILKVSGRNLPSLELADSDRLSAGDHVVVVGSPLGLENSVSDGIVSGFREDSKSRSWIQTTAPVSHGSSGGPLLTMDGRVAGVVTWKSDEGENVNFAVPSKLVAALLTKPVPPLETQPKTESGTPSLTETFDWMSNTLKMGEDNNVLFHRPFEPDLVRDGTNPYYKEVISDFSHQGCHVKFEVYVTGCDLLILGVCDVERQVDAFDLKDIDPESVGVRDSCETFNTPIGPTSSFNCEDTQGKYVRFRTTDAKPKIHEESGGRYHKSTYGQTHDPCKLPSFYCDESWSEKKPRDFTSRELAFSTPEYAARFAKALKHVVELCGGKQSAF